MTASRHPWYLRPPLQLLLIVLCGCAAYAATLTVPFVLDDFDVIVRNSTLESPARFFAPEAWAVPAFRARWLAMLSFALNRWFGGLDVTGYHLLNLALHLGCALAVRGLARTVLARFGAEVERRHAATPLLAALLFLLHPLQTQAVTYITQRMALLATLCYLGALLCYSRAATGTPDRPASRRIAYAGSLALCLLAMGSKEISATLPLALLLYDLCFLDGTPGRRLTRLAPFLLCLGYLPFLVYGMGSTPLAALSGSGSTVPPPPHLAYLLSELPVVMTYLRLLLLPVGQNLDHDVTLYHSLLQPPVMLSALALAGLASLGIVLAVRGRRHRAPLPLMGGFAILWFLLTLSVESGAVPLLDLLFEHRLYLPSAWPAIAAAAGITGLAAYRPGWRRPLAVATVLLLTLLGTATVLRNRVWRSEESLWGDVIAKSPDKARGWSALGLHRLGRLQPVEAIPLLERAVALNPGMYEALYGLGVARYQTGNRLGAAECFVRTTEAAPWYAPGWRMAGSAILALGHPAEALPYLRRALELDPNDVEARELLARATASTGR